MEGDSHDLEAWSLKLFPFGIFFPIEQMGSFSTFCTFFQQICKLVLSAIFRDDSGKKTK